MNKIDIKDNVRFREIIGDMKACSKNISDIFDKETNNYEKINATDTWTGRAGTAAYNQFKKLSRNYDPIRYSLALYIRFLEKTIDDYERIEAAINDNAQEFSEELTVNLKNSEKYKEKLTIN